MLLPGAEHGRRDRAAHQRPRRALLPRAVHGRRPHLRPAVSISGEGFLEAVQGPGGRVALVDGPTTHARRPVRPRRLERRHGGQRARSLPRRRVHRHRRVGRGGARGRLATRRRRHAFRLGAGGDPNNAAAWQQLDPAKGREPALAGLPGSFAVMLEPSGPSAGSLFVQRLEGAAWSPPVALIPAVNNNGFQLAGNTKGRLTARHQLLRLPPRLHDLDRRRRPVVLDVNIGNFEEYPSGAPGRDQRDGRGRRGRRRLRRQGRARHPLLAAHRAGRPPARSAARACRSAASAAATRAVARRRGRARQPPGRALDRPAPGQLRPHPRRTPRLPRPVPRALRRCAAAPRSIPVRVTPRRGKARTLRLRVRRCSATR